MSTYHPGFRATIIKNREKETATWEASYRFEEGQPPHVIAARPAIQDQLTGELVHVFEGTDPSARVAIGFARSILAEYRAGTLDLIRYDARAGDLG